MPSLTYCSNQCVHHEKICGQAIKDMEFDPNGSSLVVNANDRAIRVYGMSFSKDPDHRVVYILHHRFQDLISRNPWCHCKFSSDGEYVVAGEHL